MNPTRFPELLKPARDLKHLWKSNILEVKMFRTIRKHYRLLSCERRKLGNTHRGQICGQQPWFFWSLEGLNSSGKLVGFISTTPGTY